MLDEILDYLSYWFFTSVILAIAVFATYLIYLAVHVVLNTELCSRYGHYVQYVSMFLSVTAIIALVVYLHEES